MKISVDDFRNGPREIDVDLSTVPDHVLIFFGQSTEARAEYARRIFLQAKDWNPADHPRAPRGTHEGGQFVSEITHLVDEAIEGGFSYNPFTHHEPTDGYMVARVGMAVEVPAGSREEAIRGMHEFLATHRDLFEAEPDLFIGGWVENGTLIIEPSDQVHDRAEAVLLAQARDQIALFDVAGTRTIDTGGSGGARARPGYNVSPTRIFGAKGLLPTASRLLRPVRGGADRRAGGDHGPAVPGAAGLKFDPDQPRVPSGPHGGEWLHTSFGDAKDWGVTAGINDWETTKPWDRPKQDFVDGKVPGFVYDKYGVRGFSAMWMGDRIKVNDSALDSPQSETRRSMFYHEAGHAVAQRAVLQSGGDVAALLDPFRRGDRTHQFTSPFGGHDEEHTHGDEPMEILADAYAELALGRAGVWDRPELDALFAAIEAAAHDLGFPVQPRDTRPPIPRHEDWREENGYLVRKPLSGGWMSVRREGRGKYRWLAGAEGDEGAAQGTATTLAQAQRDAEAGLQRRRAYMEFS